MATPVRPIIFRAVSTLTPTLYAITSTGTNGMWSRVMEGALLSRERQLLVTSISVRRWEVGTNLSRGGIDVVIHDTEERNKLKNAGNMLRFETYNGQWKTLKFYEGASERTREEYYRTDDERRARRVSEI